MASQPASKKPTPTLPLMTGLTAAELSIFKLPMSKPMRKFLGQLTENQTQALRNRSRHPPTFCHRYFDLCEAGVAQEGMLRAGLGSLIEVLNANPEERMFGALVGLRSSFVVPVRSIVLVGDVLRS